MKGALCGETPYIIYTAVAECCRGVEKEGNNGEGGCGLSMEKSEHVTWKYALGEIPTMQYVRSTYADKAFLISK